MIRANLQTKIFSSAHWSKIEKKKFRESPRVIDRGTSAHFCVSDQYLISKVLRIK